MVTLPTTCVGLVQATIYHIGSLTSCKAKQSHLSSEKHICRRKYWAIIYSKELTRVTICKYKYKCSCVFTCSSESPCHPEFCIESTVPWVKWAYGILVNPTFATLPMAFCLIYNVDRNNKLTLLMQDSIGGNAKTLMFVNISPSSYNLEETIISLSYGQRLKQVTNGATRNAESREVARLKTVSLHKYFIKRHLCK